MPEFTWQHFTLGAPFVCDTRNFKRDGFDLIFVEDGGNWGEFKHNTIPVVYLAVDSTLTPAHYQTRLKQAAQANLVLVDHDKLARFRPAGPTVRRFPYCVNDKLFKPLDKTLDVSFHCGTGARKGAAGGRARTELRQYLHEVCTRLGYSYRSGALGLPDYAESMGKSRIVVNLPRTDTNRPHRVFDSMAAGACVVTGRLPHIEEDMRIPGYHYVPFDNIEEIPDILTNLLTDNNWKAIAKNGRDLVTLLHTWRKRSGHLRFMLESEFGI